MQQERKRLAGGLETERRWEDGISKEGERRGRRSRADGQREGEAACKEGREATAETKARIRMNDSFRLSLERAFIRTPESLFGSDARERNTGIAREREGRGLLAKEKKRGRERGKPWQRLEAPLLLLWRSSALAGDCKGRSWSEEEALTDPRNHDHHFLHQQHCSLSHCLSPLLLFPFLSFSRNVLMLMFAVIAVPLNPMLLSLSLSPFATAWLLPACSRSRRLTDRQRRELERQDV